MIQADQIFVNGRIYTMKSEMDVVEALVVKNGRILFAGSSDEARAYSAKEVVDLQGKAVLPGFTDTHMHMMLDCEMKEKVDLLDANSIDDIIRRMKERESSALPGTWLLGGRLHIEKLKEGRFPVKEELDRVSTERPILIMSYCGHAAMANSKALALAEIKKGVRTKVEGLIDFDQQGEPTGVTHETAYDEFFVPVMNNQMGDHNFRKELIKKYQSTYAKAGITTLHSFSALSGDPLEYARQYTQLDEAGELKVRVLISSTAPLPLSLGAVSGFGTDKVKYSAKKIFMDGSLSSRTAALLAPYSDAPDEDGIMLLSQEEVNRQVKEAYDYGMEVGIHAIGDKAMDMALTAIEGAYGENPESNKRFRIIHSMLAHKDQIERMKKLPVILDIQPVFIRNWIDLAEQRIGKERMKDFLPLRAYLDNGILITGGSDAPVEEVNPLLGIYYAVNRQHPDGYPEGGFLPEQRISAYEAVCMFTKNAAYCTNEENIKGTLEEGKFADFIVLDRDIFAIAPQEIHAVNVLQTYLGGEIV